MDLFIFLVMIGVLYLRIKGHIRDVTLFFSICGILFFFMLTGNGMDTVFHIYGIDQIANTTSHIETTISDVPYQPSGSVWIYGIVAIAIFIMLWVVGVIYYFKRRKMKK